MKRYAFILAVAVSLIPLAAQAATVSPTLLWTYGVAGGAYNGNEQTTEANTISYVLSLHGYNGGVDGGSSYRNSFYRIRATGGAYFTVDNSNLGRNPPGVYYVVADSVNLGSNVTIVHKQDWVGIANNLCASWGIGYNDGQNINDSDCHYVISWGHEYKYFGVNSPPPCPAGYTGVYPCTPVEEQSCSYTGTVQWSNCSAYYNGTARSGSSVTLQNTASGYSGSATYSCLNGIWNGVSSSCVAVVNGSCSSSHYNCSSGNSSNNQSNSSTWTWSCTGTNGGSTASCSEQKPVNGSCSSSHYNCSSGSSTNNQSNSTTWTWSCTGTNGGSTASCSETKAVNGSCSSSHYNCNAGSSANNSSNSTTWTWSCQGSGGGSTASCSEQKPVNGSCSSSHYNCSSGSSTNNQSNASTWTWRCNGTAGGSDASCSESKPLSTYTITASAGSGGSISPSGSVSVTQGNNQGFSINPSGGYNVSAVTVDGGNAGAVSSYTFSNVQGNHTISASFSPSNTAPNAPTISGPTTGNPNTSYTYSVSATDPQGNQIRYGIDWTEPADGTADLWLPAGVNYVNSGTSQSTSHSWATAGAHTFKALAQDVLGLNSSWTSYSVTLASCTPSYSCIGGDLYHTDASCVQSLSQTCTYGCSGSACTPPPSIQFIPFSATNPLGNFNATGHLEMKPQLLRSGDTTGLYWNVGNAQSCTATGTNGDSWSGSFSGTGGKTTSPITAQTTYTLLCTGLAGAFPASISETQTVNLIPVFQEQ